MSLSRQDSKSGLGLGVPVVMRRADTQDCQGTNVTVGVFRLRVVHIFVLLHGTELCCLSSSVVSVRGKLEVQNTKSRASAFRHVRLHKHGISQIETNSSASCIANLSASS